MEDPGTHEQIAGLGRRDELHAELQALDMPGARAGRVLAQHRGWVVAEPGGGESRMLTARGRMREQPPVTGDWVAVDPRASWPRCSSAAGRSSGERPAR